jgi:hypothetical protein
MEFTYNEAYPSRFTVVKTGDLIRDRVDGEVLMVMDIAKLREMLGRLDQGDSILVSLTGAPDRANIGEGCPSHIPYEELREDNRYEKVAQAGEWSLVNDDKEREKIISIRR